MSPASDKPIQNAAWPSLWLAGDPPSADGSNDWTSAWREQRRRHWRSSSLALTRTSFRYRPFRQQRQDSRWPSRTIYTQPGHLDLNAPDFPAIPAKIKMGASPQPGHLDLSLTSCCTPLIPAHTSPAGSGNISTPTVPVLLLYPVKCPNHCPIGIALSQCMHKRRFCGALSRSQTVYRVEPLFYSSV